MITSLLPRYSARVKTKLHKSDKSALKVKDASVPDKGKLSPKGIMNISRLRGIIRALIFSLHCIWENIALIMNQRGILLLELVIALTIISTGFLTAFYAFSLSVSNTAVFKREMVAEMLAKQKMEEILADRDISIGKDEGTFEPDYPKYKWQVETDILVETENINLFNIKLRVSWMSKSKEEFYALETSILRRPVTEKIGM